MQQRPTSSRPVVMNSDSGDALGAMVQVAPSSSHVGFFAIVALLVAALLVVATWRPDATAAEATPEPSSQTAIATATTAPTTRPTPSPTPRPTPSPRPAATPDPCVLPERLPAPEPAVAAPTVEQSPVAMVFASYLYAQAPGGHLEARDSSLNWAMGLWFVAPGSVEPRLLAAPEGGMVIPLALNPQGTEAAVWWLPERRPYGQSIATCRSGIYTLATDGSSSRLVVSGDWSLPFGGDEVRESNWSDPFIGNSTPRDYQLPIAAFSSDGTFLAVIAPDVIDLYDTRGGGVVARHVGSCTRWAWAPIGASFVAGCEDMTSAWLVARVCCDGGLEPRSVPIPVPNVGDLTPGWEVAGSRSIGLTVDGRIRIARFYGYPTGCEGPDACFIPKPGYVVSTTDPETGATTLRSGELDFLSDSWNDHPPLLSADATWLFAHDYNSGARTIRIGSGAISDARRLQEVVGAASDGSAIYGSRVVDDRARIVVAAVTRSGNRIDLTSITWALDADISGSGFDIVGLRVSAGT